MSPEEKPAAAKNEAPRAPDRAAVLGKANFNALVVSIASSATVFMGLVPHPGTNEKKVDLNTARFNIDLLLMLQDKTKGNLDAGENEFLSKVVQDLQIKFVAEKQKAADAKAAKESLNGAADKA